MLGLPASTEISKQLPKKAIYAKFDLKPEQRDRFDTDVNETVITEVAKQKPYYFVMRDASLSSDNVADNFEQIFNAYSRDTIRKIL